MKGYFSLILTHLISPLGGERTKAEVVYLPENKRRRNVNVAQRNWAVNSLYS